jgi:hypothetical protein
VRSTWPFAQRSGKFSPLEARLSRLAFGVRRSGSTPGYQDLQCSPMKSTRWIERLPLIPAQFILLSNLTKEQQRLTGTYVQNQSFVLYYQGSRTRLLLWVISPLETAFQETRLERHHYGDRHGRVEMNAFSFIPGSLSRIFSCSSQACPQHIHSPRRTDSLWCTFSLWCTIQAFLLQVPSTHRPSSSFFQPTVLATGHHHHGKEQMPCHCGVHRWPSLMPSLILLFALCNSLERVPYFEWSR